MNPYRIVLADDHIMVRQGMKKLIEESEEMEVVAEASDGRELLRLLERLTVDMVILDISMPIVSGIEAAKRIKKLYSNIKLLILTMHRRKDYLDHALSVGIDGYLVKEDRGSEIFSAIEKIRLGEVYISPILSKMLTADYVQAFKVDVEDSSASLSKREIEILKLITVGRSNREIAETLFISIRTVENHRANIMRKLKLRKITDLVKYAIQKGYTSSTFC